MFGYLLKFARLTHLANKWFAGMLFHASVWNLVVECSNILCPTLLRLSSKQSYSIRQFGINNIKIQTTNGKQMPKVWMLMNESNISIGWLRIINFSKMEKKAKENGLVKFQNMYKERCLFSLCLFSSGRRNYAKFGCDVDIDINLLKTIFLLVVSCSSV